MSNTIKQIKSMIEYQSDSIVSQRVIQKPSGNVTLFAFDEGQELTEHTSPFEALIVVVEGEADISIDQVSQTVHEGELIQLPANHPHAVKANKKFKMILTLIRS